MTSFNGLWPCLKMGGLYVVEDLMYNYWEKYVPFKDGGFKHPQNVMEKFKSLADTLNKHSVGVANLMTLFPGDQELCKITFGMNVLAAGKCTPEQMTYQKVSDGWAKAKKKLNRINTKKIALNFANLRKKWP